MYVQNVIKTFAIIIVWKDILKNLLKIKNLDSLEDEFNVLTENTDIPIEVDDTKPNTIQICNNNINNVNNSTINNNINLINNINISITKSFD